MTSQIIALTHDMTISGTVIGSRQCNVETKRVKLTKFHLNSKRDGIHENASNHIHVKIWTLAPSAFFLKIITTGVQIVICQGVSPLEPHLSFAIHKLPVCKISVWLRNCLSGIRDNTKVLK